MKTRTVRSFVCIAALSLAAPVAAQTSGPSAMTCNHEKCIEHCQEKMESAKTSAAAARHMEQARFHQAMAAAYRGRMASAAQHCDRQAARHRDAASATPAATPAQQVAHQH